MARQKIIIGLGAAVLAEYPEHTVPAGLAAEVAMHAARLGHAGVAISRVGQDPAGEELVALLAAAGVDTALVQRDPDLPTGRIVIRAIGGRIPRYVETRAAFENLQWDFDLEDVAPQVDAVVFDLLARRSGQTRSEENRFLEACGAAVKVYDLTARERDPDRGLAQGGAELADGLVVDAIALDTLVPGAAARPRVETVPGLMRDHGLSFILELEGEGDARRMTLFGGEEVLTERLADSPAAATNAVVTMLHGVLRGQPFGRSLSLASRVAALIAESAEASIPKEWLA